MCGICGWYSRRNADEKCLKEMTDSMLHRGPDDSGEKILTTWDGWSIGLGHRRLSIHDLSSAGHQPMSYLNDRVTVVFNGEIYNYLELKKELTDYSFRSSSDTEVLLAAYVHWGVSFVNHLNGMFAIALFDSESEKLILARDRIGKKPLYYWISAMGTLVFASELKPLMKYPGFHPEINRDVLSRFLFQQYINAPDSIFEGVSKLEPGGYLVYRKGKLEKESYWDISKRYREMREKPIHDYREAKEGLKKRLRKSVSERLFSDVPVGCFLSGGYDSSLVSAIAQETLGDVPLKTFSIGVADGSFDEAVFAKKIAAFLGTEHTEYYCSESDMLRLLPEVSKYFDEPFADSSQIPTMLVSKLAKKEVSVVLSGDGGDELFCGYNIYSDIRLEQLLDPLGAVVYAAGKAMGLEKRFPYPVRAIAENRNKKTKTQAGGLFYEKVISSLVLPSGNPLSQKYEFDDRYPEKNWQIRRMLLDMETYLPGDILCKVDRASMKYSLEARCPILDKEIIEYSFRLDHKMKFYRGIKKRILKDIAYEYLPRELLDREKSGFGIPYDSWMRKPVLSERIRGYAERGYLQKQGIFAPDYTHAFVTRYLEQGDQGRGTGENYARIVWAFFIFQMWAEYYGLNE